MRAPVDMDVKAESFGGSLVTEAPFALSYQCQLFGVADP